MGWRSALGPRAMFGNFGNLVHTFSDFDVDVLSHLELRERGDCPVLLLGPVEELLIAVGKGLLLYVGEEGEVFRLKPDLWAQRYLEEKKKKQECKEQRNCWDKTLPALYNVFSSVFSAFLTSNSISEKMFSVKSVSLVENYMHFNVAHSYCVTKI